MLNIVLCGCDIVKIGAKVRSCNSALNKWRREQYIAE
jgi:hypothetical protein